MYMILGQLTCHTVCQVPRHIRVITGMPSYIKQEKYMCYMFVHSVLSFDKTYD